MTIHIDGGPLTVEQVLAVADGAPVEVDPAAYEAMAPARELVERLVAEGRTVYGITTGFGALANTRIEPELAAEAQVALLRSHASGVGDPLSDDVVRAMMLLRARTLAQGHSGVRPKIVETQVALLDAGILPVVPGQGSVGASGDLAPFAHLALPLIGEGEVTIGGAPARVDEALAAAGIDPVVLEPKEGLSLLNGTEGMLAMGVLALRRARRIAAAADIACALSVEALLGSERPFLPMIHGLRPHPGQVASAAAIRATLSGSEIISSHSDDFSHAVQDAYSLRCAPQVHGAVLDVLAHAERVFTTELGSVADNPLVFADEGLILSGGNFHGQPLAFALDFMAIGVTELGSISERRTDRILDPERSAGLPPFLATRPGLNSGYMLTQYTAAALVAENRVLSHPASVESIPTSGSQEDHVSMGWGAARKLGDVLTNTARVIAVEILCAVEGIDHRSPLVPGVGSRAAVEAIRRVVPPLDTDRPPAPHIEVIATMIEDGSLGAAVGRAAVGGAR